MDKFNPDVYKKHVKEAKLYLRRYTRHSKDAADARNKVADIAIKVRRYYKLVAFAQDIGLNYNTLHSWMSERERPVKSIIKEEGDDLDKSALRRTLKQISKDDTPEKAQAIYTKEKNKSKEDITVDNILYFMDDAMFSICNKFVLEKLDQQRLHTIYLACLAITKKLMEHFNQKGDLNERPKEEIRTS